MMMTFVAASLMGAYMASAEAPAPLRTPSELVEIGLARSRVLMMNEAHSGFRRCLRTREVGLSVIPAAHAAGVRHLAMEALTPDFARQANATRHLPEFGGYLGQPDMRRLMQAALDAGWNLIAYEAEESRWEAQHGPLTPEARLSMSFTNWREEEQARNLAAALKSLPAQDKLMVWSGNGHLEKSPIGDWTPMGWHFARLSGTPAFAIDQSVTVNVGAAHQHLSAELLRIYGDALRAQGPTAGFLREDGPGILRNSSPDAFIVSLENELQ
jgi:hypothetical protein